MTEDDERVAELVERTRRALSVPAVADAGNGCPGVGDGCPHGDDGHPVVGDEHPDVGVGCPDVGDACPEADGKRLDIGDGPTGNGRPDDGPTGNGRPDDEPAGGTGLDEVEKALATLEPHVGELSAVEAVDLLERASATGRLESVRTLHRMVPDFAYEAFALALALRYGHEKVARDLLARGVDLLQAPHQPKGTRGLIPHEATFTRFALTRTSPTLFLNPLDPTVATEVFEAASAREQLAGEPYPQPFDLARSCALVAHLAADGLFEPAVFDDLFRASLVRASKALRRDAQRDEGIATTCLDLAARLLELRRRRDLGDDRLDRVLGSMVVPKADPLILRLVARRAPEVFLERLQELPWLREDAALVAGLVPWLAPGTPEQNGTLLAVLARAGDMVALAALDGWEGTFTDDNLSRAMDAATSAGHAEVAAWLLARRQEHIGIPSAADDLLDDLLL